MPTAQIKFKMNLEISSKAADQPPLIPPTPKCFINYEGIWCSLRYSMQWSSKSNRDSFPTVPHLTAPII